MAARAGGAPLPARALAPYVLAGIGGVAAWFPLLTLLLPIKVAALAGEARVGVLATCAVLGSIAAGAANIVFGWLGDRSVARGRGRRGWLVGGVLATAATLMLLAAATTARVLVIDVMLFQVAVNALLAAAGALTAEEVPDTRKGLVSGLLAIGPPAGAGLSALLLASGMGEFARLAAVAAIVAGLVLPLALIRAPARVSPPPAAERPRRRRDLAVAWVARLLMQVAGCAVPLYLLYYVDALAGRTSDAATSVAWLLLVGTTLPAPAAVLIGRWSDRSGRRTPFLSCAALVAALGLAAMAAAATWPVGAAGYVLFAGGSNVFVALNLGLAMQLLPDPVRRGRDMGLINLANTLPSTIGPLLAWGLAKAGHFDTALAGLALVTAAAAGLTLLVREAA